MNLVVGATGLLGEWVARRLCEERQPVRALVRPTSDAAKRDVLQKAGAALVIGDLKDPASLAASCAGVSAVVATASSTLSRQAGDDIDSVDHRGYETLIAAAKKAGVKHFVYVSIPAQLSDSPLSRAKRRIERALIDSGIGYTILRPNYFMEIWLSPALGFDHAKAHATIYGDGARPLSWVSYKDVGEVAVRALGENRAANRTVDVGGPEDLSPLEAVRIFEKTANRAFQVDHVPQSALESQKRQATDPLSESLAALMLDYAAGCVSDAAETRQITPLKPTTVAQYAQSVVGR